MWKSIQKRETTKYKQALPGYQLQQPYPGPPLPPGFCGEKGTTYKKATRGPAYTHLKQSNQKPLPGPKVHNRANTLTTYKHLKQPCPKSTQPGYNHMTRVQFKSPKNPKRHKHFHRNFKTKSRIKTQTPSRYTLTIHIYIHIHSRNSKPKPRFSKTKTPNTKPSQIKTRNHKLILQTPNEHMQYQNKNANRAPATFKDYQDNIKHISDETI